MRWTLALLLTAAACDGSSPTPPKAQPKADMAAKKAPAAAKTPKKEEVPAVHTAIFAPLDKAMVAAAEKPMTDLGRMLYYETRLSLSHEISCNSCHQLDKFGVDGEPTSPGHKGQRGDRNSPTSLNAFGHLAQFWDGRAPDVEAQAKGPILNPVEMAMKDEAAVIATLQSIPGYVEAFAKAFPGEEAAISYDNMAKAIGAFERKLTTPGRFDTYLKGDASALSVVEKKGLETFISTGCTTCHLGAYVGGQSYQKLGLVLPYETEDIGRAKVTDNEADKYVFKVPSLRNIAETGPYLHDGSISSLEEMVQLMGKHQLGKELSADDTASIVTFLHALTGEVDKAYVAEPKLPESGPQTPKPAL